MTDINLPKEWIDAQLGSFNEIQSGIGFPKIFQGRMSGVYPVYKVGDVSRSVLNAKGKLAVAENYVDESDVKQLRGFVFQEGTTLFAKIGEAVRLNRRAYVTKKGLADNNVMGVKPFFNEMDKFVHYFLKTVELGEASRSTTVPSIRKSDIEEIGIPFPPLAEQQQIAQKLDELLAQVDTLKARLDAIPKILKRFRQSVLAAAVSGKLTEEWRGKQAEKLDEWRWVTLGEIADVKGGITKDSKKQESSFIELPYLRVANVQRYFLDLNEVKTIRIPERRVKDLLLEDGDILFNEGGDLDKLGRGWIWEGQIKKCSYQNHVFRARLKNKSDSSKYISWWGNTEGFEYFIRNGKQTTNLASINKTLLSNLPINLPSPKEQTEIVRRVEQLFAYADQIEQRVKNSQARVNHLTQSILAKAFRGELTAEWRAQNLELVSGENSAAALLEKIKAERVAIVKPKRLLKGK